MKLGTHDFRKICSFKRPNLKQRFFFLLVIAACCNDLVLALNGKQKHSKISKLLGVYQFDYNQTKLEEIENGNFTFKKNKGRGYIFKDTEGIWSVRN